MPPPSKMVRFADVEPRRSALMSRIRSPGTKPEIAVRKALHALGFRFRLHRRDLPGKPDIVLPRYRLAIFIHGCFWHQHAGCRLASRPKTREEYWGPKLAANVARDELHATELIAAGWRVETIWECDTREAKRLERVVDEIDKALRQRVPGNHLAEVASADRQRVSYNSLRAQIVSR
jgi:DNA mismatch endonuclease, patch repair protein